MWVWSPGSGRSPGREHGTHSSIFAWKIPWTEEPGRQQSIGLQRVGHDQSNLAHMSRYKLGSAYTVDLVSSIGSLCGKGSALHLAQSNSIRTFFFFGGGVEQNKISFIFIFNCFPSDGCTIMGSWWDANQIIFRQHFQHNLYTEQNTFLHIVLNPAEPRLWGCCF